MHTRQNVWRRGVRGAIAGLMACLIGMPATGGGALAQEPQNIGQTAAVLKGVNGKVGANVRKLNIADAVYANEVIETEEGGASKLRFLDDTELSVGPNSSLTLDEFIYDPAAGNTKMVVTMAVGVARFVTGSVGTRDFEVRTQTATIGIRGTTLTVIVNADGTTTVTVSEGSVTVTSTDGTQVVVNDGASSTVPPGGQPSLPGPPPLDVAATLANFDTFVLKLNTNDGTSTLTGDAAKAEILRLLTQSAENPNQSSPMD